MCSEKGVPIPENKKEENIMKNLKKVLALVMAFAMAFTMMAGAAYTDQADITATEAVDTLAALNIMTGDTNGSFRPNDTVTRAEMCRMILLYP